MSGIYHITPWSLRTAVTPNTVKILKKAQKKALALEGLKKKQTKNTLFNEQENKRKLL